MLRGAFPVRKDYPSFPCLQASKGLEPGVQKTIFADDCWPERRTRGETSQLKVNTEVGSLCN